MACMTKGSQFVAIHTQLHHCALLSGQIAQQSMYLTLYMAMFHSSICIHMSMSNYMASAMHDYMVKEVNTVGVALKASIEQIETVFVTSYMNVKPQICEETDL